MSRKRKEESAAILADKMEKVAIEDKSSEIESSEELVKVAEKPFIEVNETDWSLLPDEVKIEALVSNKHLKKGQVYQCGKDSAFRLVKNKLAVLVK